MAFVSQSQRIIHPKLKEKWKLIGPGQYDPDNCKLNQANYQKVRAFQAAPFNSSTVKKTIFNDSKNNSSKPGPGSYRVNNKMFQPALKAYSNQKCLIIKLNSLGSSQFLSQVQRFAEPKSSINPGPGNYQVKQSSFESKSQSKKNNQHYKNNSSKCKQKIKQLAKQIKKKPSIPSKYQNPFILAQKSRVNTQITESCHQQQQHLHNNNKKVKSYSWSKAKRDISQLSKTVPIGPGKYQVEKDILKSSKNKKLISQNANFKSESLRMFDTIIYESNRKLLVEQRSLRQFKSNRPGPGSYQTNYSFIKNIDSEFVYQFFGSTVERFKPETKNCNQKLTYIDQEQSNKKRNKSFNHAHRPFLSEQRRDMKFLTVNQQIPGPGTYIVRQSKNNIRKGKSVQNFGSSIKRFDQTIVLPDPAYQIQLQLQKKISQAKHKLSKLKTQSSIFKSKSKRNCFSSQEQLDLFGSYDTSYYDLSTQIKRQSQLLENLKKINIQKPAFDVKQPRFGHYQQKKPVETKVDNKLRFISRSKKDRNGQQTKLVQKIYVQSKNQAEGQKKSVIFNQSQRFQSFQNRGPGVGQYSIRSNWHKKSHNIKFKTQT